MSRNVSYANFFRIGHNAFEFLLEFGQETGQIHSRIYISPKDAQMFSNLLREVLRSYEPTRQKDTSSGSQQQTCVTLQ